MAIFLGEPGVADSTEAKDGTDGDNWSYIISRRSS